MPFFEIGSGGGGGGYVMPDSATYPFNSNAARNSWANNNLGDLIKNQTVVNVGGNNWFLWRGESNPDTYNSNDWIEANPIVVGQTGEKGDTGDYGQLQSVDIIGDDFIFTDNSGSESTLTGAVTQLKGDTGERGEKGDTGEAGLIVTAEFSGDDIVFTDNNNNQSTLANAVTTLQGERGQRGEKGEQGTPFIIQKQYSSAGEMIADFAGTDVGENEMVMIATGAGNPDNGDVYTKGATAWNYVTTLDGASSIQGVAGNDGVDGQDGSDGQDGASVNSATVNPDGDLEIGLDSGVDINAGRVTGLSAYEVWIADGNAGTEEDYIAYLRERIKFNNEDVESIGFDVDSGLFGRVINDELTLSAPLVGDPVTDSDSLPPAMPTELDVKLRSIRYHPSMPEQVMIETGTATKVINTLPHGSSYLLTPTSHGNTGLTGSEYLLSQAAGAQPNTGKYESIPLFVFQPDTTVGFRNAFGYVNYPAGLNVDFSTGFYLTGLVSGYYAGNTNGKSFLYVGNGTDAVGNASGIGVYFASDGCHAVTNGSDVVIDSEMTYNSQNGQPCFYRVAVYQLQSGVVYTAVRDCLTGRVINSTIAGLVNQTETAKVWIGCDRDGATNTVAFGEITLWIPDHDEDVSKVNWRG